MDKYSFIFQINTGSFTNRHYTESQLLDNINRLFGYIKGEKVILGWFPDPDMYKKSIELIHSFNAEAYIWLPVFADVMPSLGFHGKSEVTKTASDDENFAFVLPEVGTAHVITEYNTVADDAPFDGVFLDRIRYGVPSSNLTRVEKITQAASELTEYFHTKNLKVGLDLFAPHLAPFMGQDSQKLGKIADFIKPMMYWSTTAPAGIPYEENVFNKKLQKKVEYKEEMLTELSSCCDVYPGIEVNKIRGICNTTPDYVAEKIKYFKKSHCKGAVLSWNSPDASDEMLLAISKL